MTPILELQQVDKRYGSLAVTQAVTLSVPEGEALGVIGPNGAGKTTLFNLIAGDVRPDKGEVIYQGQAITRKPPHERCHAGIGRTYQIPHPFGGMTVFENVLVGAAFGQHLSEREADETCMEVLEITGLRSKADKLSGSLGLLDRKRLELARALSTNPKLLLLDEIAGGLTEHEIQELLETIKDLRKRGVTLIWVEHIVHALMAVVDRLAVIHTGKLLMTGEPASVMAAPEVQEIYLGMEA